jgi:hypothetical protein
MRPCSLQPGDLQGVVEVELQRREPERWRRSSRQRGVVRAVETELQASEECGRNDSAHEDVNGGRTRWL